MIRAVLFDVDGTLVNSVVTHVKAYVDAFAERGITADPDVLAHAIGLAGHDVLPLILSPEQIAECGDDVLHRKGAIWNERYKEEATPIPGTRELIAYLEAAGFLMAIGSSATQEELGTLKRLGGISDLLPIEVDADDVKHTKPAPDVWLAAAGKLKVTPDVCVALGDTPYDMEAARNAGMRGIGMLTGFFNGDALREAGAEEVYVDPTDLLKRMSESRFLSDAPNQEPVI